MRDAHLLLVVPQVWLEAPEADLCRGQPRPAGWDVSAVVGVPVHCIVHTSAQQVPCHQRRRRRRRPIPPPRVCFHPLVHPHGLAPAHAAGALILDFD